MFRGNCPDTMINLTPAELNVHQLAALYTSWPAAHEAVLEVNRAITADDTNMEAGDAFVAPLYSVVRWYLSLPGVDN